MLHNYIFPKYLRSKLTKTFICLNFMMAFTLWMYFKNVFIHWKGWMFHSVFQLCLGSCKRVFTRIFVYELFVLTKSSFLAEGLQDINKPINWVLSWKWNQKFRVSLNYLEIYNHILISQGSKITFSLFFILFDICHLKKLQNTVYSVINYGI